MDIRTEILDEATRLFAKKGFDGTTLQAIAERVGIRKPSLLYHFRSKEELRDRVFEHVVEHWNRTLPGIVTAVVGGEDRFEAVTHEMVRFFTAEPDLARLFLRELLDRPETLSAGIATHLRPWVETLGNYIAKGKRSGEILPSVDSYAYITQIMTLILAGIAAGDVLTSALPQPVEAEAGRERMLQEILRIAKSSLFGEPGREESRRQPQEQ